MFIHSMRAETRWQNTALFDIFWERACWVTKYFTTLHVSANDHKSAVSIDFGVPNKV